jgi:hypothetical protein
MAANDNSGQLGKYSRLAKRYDAKVKQFGLTVEVKE